MRNNNEMMIPPSNDVSSRLSNNGADRYLPPMLPNAGIGFSDASAGAAAISMPPSTESRRALLTNNHTNVNSAATSPFQ